ncbi:MAG: aryl-sulfate sulfotransferase [Candidatus Tectomicrobia bacterium]|uniref:Aryl-sulfate sulfotransferase n=1 Tax=Tectimicrobiota bacterium TaxID=2528274 RepID=A0A932GPA5_UNCTE|nr:aryl-sulfate sulfotransferase [Candidatus Tectomicrobia bacterium]
MKKLFLILAISSLALIPATLLAFPTVYPTGTTIYKPEKCWNGYTVLQNAGIKWTEGREGGTVLIDMNGNVLSEWPNIHFFPAKILPGGHIMGYMGSDGPGHESSKKLVQMDWNGNVVWQFEMAGQEHDFQREGNPVGYYAPGMEPKVDRGNTLTLVYRKNIKKPQISPQPLTDTAFLEVTWDGRVVWEWLQSDHFEEMEFSEEARNAMSRSPSGGDWAHINNMNVLGPNTWYDMGDQRFHPDNIIYDARVLNIIAIIDKKTGKLVWKVGPDYTATPALRKLGQIIGPHQAHMIPRGLPGEGNILVFDNGGFAGYGNPNPGSPTGMYNALRDYSRVIEFDPVTMEIVWEYSMRAAGHLPRIEGHKFYSPYMSGAQRLPNGNTLITEAASGRVFEVTPEREIVWEFVSPFFYPGNQGIGGDPTRQYPPINHLYRAYRVPYGWVPQVKKPKETSVIPPPNSELRVPQSAPATSVKPAETQRPARKEEREEEQYPQPLRY